MLEKLPHAVGEALSGLKAGLEKTAFHAAFADAPATLRVTSEAFADGAAMPARFTEDGAKVSPPLAWSGIPTEARSVAILAEDADSPTPKPLVHLIVFNLAGQDGSLAEGALASPDGPGAHHALGKNSFLKDQYLPPDPPTGHGPHRYVFQVYALDGTLDLAASPGRGALLGAMAGRVLAKGQITGTYART
ncbi:YbhB/YbcL family Raf kinase inhibitor-like protein [Methylobacterium planeticum]|uniref:YbhB/YbcL family Raf kinase inhibitor-like protein n=1 Tax=Methylobacterium planeticum TaxID=2615211 RepID=A0A6N6MPB9_9HYPH|nr:YbhB/YbcL family Raf kinase inhibitor-like protein [Methylobacterium planeticum]KAB1071028.1 YbhB/YbcL family Raf kinase inhibitor-like protein [Methylobacterium planeticum]